MNYLTKAQALQMFRDNIAPMVREEFGRGDVIALREEWNNFTDAMYKDGQISLHQYDTWANPF